MANMASHDTCKNKTCEANDTTYACAIGQKPSCEASITKCSEELNESIVAGYSIQNSFAGEFTLVDIVPGRVAFVTISFPTHSLAVVNVNN